MDDNPYKAPDSKTTVIIRYEDNFFKVFIASTLGAISGLLVVYAFLTWMSG